jgi:hypothetical protein
MSSKTLSGGNSETGFRNDECARLTRTLKNKKITRGRA